MEDSPAPGEIPLRFIIKAAIPAGFFLIVLQGISLSIKSFLVIIGKDMEKETKKFHVWPVKRDKGS